MRFFLKNALLLRVGYDDLLGVHDIDFQWNLKSCFYGPFHSRPGHAQLVHDLCDLCNRLAKTREGRIEILLG